MALAEVKRRQAEACPTKTSHAGTILLRSLVKWHRNDFCGCLIRADPDRDFRSGSFGCRWHISHPNVLFQKGCGRSAGHAAVGFAGDGNRATVARDEPVLHLETNERAINSIFFLPYKRFASQEFALGRFADPAEARFPRRGCIVNFVAVQAHGCFKAQRVARTQAAGQQTVTSSRVQKRGPQFFGMFRREINFEAVFSRVTRARNQAVDAIYFAKSKMVILDLLEGHVCESLEGAQGSRSLNGKLRVAFARIFDLCADGIVRAYMLEVLILVAGVYAKKVVRVGNFVHEQIVDERALCGHQAGILRLAHDELRGVVACNMLNEREGVRSADFNFAHVADVKQAGSRARGHVLRDDAGVLDRHIPAAKIDHFGFEAPVDGVQCCFA